MSLIKKKSERKIKHNINNSDEELLMTTGARRVYVLEIGALRVHYK